MRNKPKILVTLLTKTKPLSKLDWMKKHGSFCVNDLQMDHWSAMFDADAVHPFKMKQWVTFMCV